MNFNRERLNSTNPTALQMCFGERELAVDLNLQWQISTALFTLKITGENTSSCELKSPICQIEQLIRLIILMKGWLTE
jgi:hypothetical protein